MRQVLYRRAIRLIVSDKTIPHKLPGVLQGLKLLSKCTLTSGNDGKELNAGQYIFEWKIFTQKGVYL